MQQEAYIEYQRLCAWKDMARYGSGGSYCGLFFAQRMSTHPLRSKHLISEYAASNFYAKLKPNFDHGHRLNPTRDRQ